MEFIKNTIAFLISIVGFLLFSLIGLLITGGTIWVSLFLFGWFLGMIGVL